MTKSRALVSVLRPGRKSCRKWRKAGGVWSGILIVKGIGGQVLEGAKLFSKGEGSWMMLVRLAMRRGVCGGAGDDRDAMGRVVVRRAESREFRMFIIS